MPNSRDRLDAFVAKWSAITDEQWFADKSFGSEFFDELIDLKKIEEWGVGEDYDTSGLERILDTYRRRTTSKPTDSCQGKVRITPHSGIGCCPVFGGHFDHHLDRGPFQVRISVWGWPARIIYRMLIGRWARKGLHASRYGNAMPIFLTKHSD